MERARCIAVDSHLPRFLSPEAVAMATFLINRSPTRTNFGIPPEASYTGIPVNLKDLKIFGSLAFVHVPDGERKKLDYKSRRCMFVGYDLNQKRTESVTIQGGRLLLLVTWCLTKHV